MKIFKTTAVALAVFATALATPPQQASAGLFEDEKILQIFVLENARIYTEEEARIFEAAKLSKFREFATGAVHPSDSTVYDVIFTSRANTSAFRGNQDQLKAEGNHLIAASALQPTCNALAEAWATAARTVEIEAPDVIHVTVIGPAIDTGLNCDASTPISLPRAFSPQMALAGILADPRVVSFQAYMVHGDQEQMLLNHISLLGGWDRKRSGALTVEIHNPQRTITALGLRRFLR